MPPDKWKEEHDYRLQELIRLLGKKDASVPEGRRTALTVDSLRERCSVGVGRDQKRSGCLSDANASRAERLVAVKTQHGRVLPKIPTLSTS